MNNLKIYQILLIFLLMLTTFIIFAPILDANYARIDDHIMLKSYLGTLKNISFDYIIKTFTKYHEGLYHPIITLSYSLETTIFGYFPALFHFDNILLHILNILLVFFIFFNLSKSFWLSFIISTLFAIHPTRVEVVAWISARKDLIYALFYLLSIFFYIKTYTSKRYKTFLTISVICYLFSCLSKSMAITLPFILLLIDLYTNHFDKTKIKTYITFIAITIIFIFLTFDSHYSNIEHVRFHFDTFRQILNFINAHFNILFYIDKLFLPINLYCMYPYFYNEFASMPPSYILYAPAIVYILIFFTFVSLQKTKVIFYGFLFFIISMLPVSGIFPIGDFVVADRYTYIPYLGLFLILAKFIIFLCTQNYIIKLHDKAINISKYLKIFIVCLCIILFSILNYLSYKRVIDWKQNNIFAPRWMSYYQFGISKDYIKEDIRK